MKGLDQQRKGRRIVLVIIIATISMSAAVIVAFLPPGIVGLVKQALAAIKSKSELRDLWEESDGFDEWSKSVSDLEARLGR